MSNFRTNLPQLSGKICITDGGMETDLIFNKKIDLPEFASYDLLRTQQGYETLYDYYKVYAKLAQRFKLGLILETPTWRANPEWGQKIGDSVDSLHGFNLKSVKLIEHIREHYQTEHTPIIISGCIGPRGDGYIAGKIMTVADAQQYHSTQISSLAETNTDLVSALTLNYVEEAIGIALAAQQYGLPVCISFTVETDGKLPTGDTLEQAILAVDGATNNAPVYYMINCAHPTHIDHLFDNSGDHWLKRLKGIRGNASCLSHKELDEAEVLDDGNPVAFGIELGKLKDSSPHITVLGGCCGTDHRHIEEVCNNVAVA